MIKRGRMRDIDGGWAWCVVAGEYIPKTKLNISISDYIHDIVHTTCGYTRDCLYYYNISGYTLSQLKWHNII